MAAFTPLSAKNAVVRFNTYILTAKLWTVTPKCDKLDVTNFEGAGFGQYITGILDADVSIDGDWDSANDPFSNPPAIVVGQIMSGVKLYTNGLASAFWSFPLLVITETPQKADVRGSISITITGSASGSFVYP
jgi:hypothetical protein